ncbi:B-box zinc finger protein [Pseudomonas borbori]
MKCFYHQQDEAIALCKSCTRALCRCCAADVHPGTACINRCEKDVEELNIVNTRNQSAYQKAGKAHKRGALATLIMGLTFILIGGLPVAINNNYDASFMAVIGLIFLLWSYFGYKSGKQIEAEGPEA